jgi:RNA polymerase sigma-70 factor (ECF subfamily)
VIERDQELRALMIRYQSGSLEAFQEIYAQLAPGVRRYLLHLAGGSAVADDLLQETFLQMHRSRAAYNPAYAVKPWVFGLARNVFLMNRRAARRWAEVHESRADLPEFPVLPEVDKLGSRDEIRRCIACLPPDQAEALLLHHEWGFSFDEIAGMLGINAQAARARASRGMADLRVALNRFQRARA